MARYDTWIFAAIFSGNTRLAICMTSAIRRMALRVRLEPVVRSSSIAVNACDNFNQNAFEKNTPRTSNKPAFVNTRISNAMYWSVSFSASAPRCWVLYSSEGSGASRGLRYTEGFQCEYEGHMTEVLLVNRRPSMNVLYHSGALMFNRSKNISRTIS